MGRPTPSRLYASTPSSDHMISVTRMLLQCMVFGEAAASRSYAGVRRISEAVKPKRKEMQDELPHETQFWCRRGQIGSCHDGPHASASDTIASSGMGETATGSYVCFPVKQHSECSTQNYSQSPPVAGNRKAEYLSTGNRQEDKDPNGDMTVITMRDEAEKRDYSYNSLFASAQFLTIAVSSLLLCFMVLFPNFAKKYQAITAAALMAATLGSLVSLEAIPKWPNLARSCGYLAIVSLLVALASILSASVKWGTM